jgi:tyrosyl-tRNA synthetase
MKLSEELVWRDQIKDKTFEDITWLDTPRTFYLGTDCSADSLTVGNLAVYILAHRLMKAGWKAVLLVGGATSLIGDPGGKDKERPLKPREEIEANVRGIKAQVQRLVGGQEFTLVDNYDWFKNIGFLEFLRDIGKYFGMTELLQREYITERLREDGSGISYAEFSYSMIQGYDYWYLFKNHGVVLQIGASDQWGNMLSGVPLIRKKENKTVHAFSIPLVIDRATGKKYGKSEEGAIWLDEKRTSVFKFYQFWLNVDDLDLERFFKIYSLREKGEIERILAQFKEAPKSRSAQKALAYEVTKIVHGEARVESARRVTGALFGSSDYTTLTNEDFEALKQELPHTTIQAGDSILDLLVTTSLASSKGEARRFIESGGVYVNGTALEASQASLTDSMFIHDYAILRRGKNTLALVSR